MSVGLGETFHEILEGPAFVGIEFLPEWHALERLFPFFRRQTLKSAHPMNQVLPALGGKVLPMLLKFAEPFLLFWGHLPQEFFAPS